MDIFKLHTDQNAKIYKLTTHGFEESTKKKAPYYTNSSSRMKYFALCPECNNPIQIINLYTDRSIDLSGRIVSTHGRHHKSDVPGLADYCQEAYDGCSLADPSSFSCSEIHSDPRRANEIVGLLKTYPGVLFDNIRNITGINFTTKDFSKMVHTFITAKGYYYRYVSKWNLPYSFINMQQSIDIAYRAIYRSTFDSELKAAINSSQFFVVNEKNMIVKKSSIKSFCMLNLRFQKHSLGTGNKQETVDLIIEESGEKTQNIVFAHTLEIDKFRYINRIIQVVELHDIVAKISED